MTMRTFGLAGASADSATTAIARVVIEVRIRRNAGIRKVLSASHCTLSRAKMAARVEKVSNPHVHVLFEITQFGASRQSCNWAGRASGTRMAPLLVASRPGRCYARGRATRSPSQRRIKWMHPDSEHFRSANLTSKSPRCAVKGLRRWQCRPLGRISGRVSALPAVLSPRVERDPSAGDCRERYRSALHRRG